MQTVPAPYVAETPMADNASANVVREARAALRGGDPRRCLQLLDTVSASLPSTLRLEGDCWLRMGNRVDAVRTYERFCARYPSHPSIGELRNLVASLGGECR